MLAQEETRRRVSIDFTLSEEQRERLRTRHGLTVPISVLSKRPLRNFDLRDEDHGARPILGRADNRALALTALLSAVARRARRSAAGRPRRLADGGPAADRLRRRGARARGAGGVRRRRGVGRRDAGRGLERPRVSQHAADARDRLRAVRGAAAERARPARHQVQLRRGLPARAAAGIAAHDRYARERGAVARAQPRSHVVSHRLPRGVAGGELPHGDRDPRGPADRQRRARAVSARARATAIADLGERRQGRQPRRALRGHGDRAARRRARVRRDLLRARGPGDARGADGARGRGAAVARLAVGPRCLGARRGRVAAARRRRRRVGLRRRDRLSHHRQQDPAQPAPGARARRRLRADGIGVAGDGGPRPPPAGDLAAAAILCSLAALRLGWSAVRAAR